MKIIPFRLASADMTEAELETERRRRGYWLRLARDRVGLTQNEVSRRLGMSQKSGGTVSLWETGARDLNSTRIAQLARLYRVPRKVFSEPRQTDEEWLESIATGAAELEREDWESGDRAVPPDGGEPAGEPDTSVA